MTTRELGDAVTGSDEGGYDFVCPRPVGCGDPESPFRSTGWPTKKAATARGQQHLDEHDGKGLMPELDVFRREQGIQVDAEGVARVKDES